MLRWGSCLERAKTKKKKEDFKFEDERVKKKT